MLHSFTLRGDCAATLQPLRPQALTMTTIPQLPPDAQRQISIQPQATYPRPWSMQALQGQHAVHMVNVIAANGQIVVMAIYTSEAMRILDAVNASAVGAAQVRTEETQS